MCECCVKVCIWFNEPNPNILFHIHKDGLSSKSERNAYRLAWTSNKRPRHCRSVVVTLAIGIRYKNGSVIQNERKNREKKIQISPYADYQQCSAHLWINNSAQGVLNTLEFIQNKRKHFYHTFILFSLAVCVWVSTIFHARDTYFFYYCFKYGSPLGRQCTLKSIYWIDAKYLFALQHMLLLCMPCRVIYGTRVRPPQQEGNALAFIYINFSFGSPFRNICSEFPFSANYKK